MNNYLQLKFINKIFSELSETLDKEKSIHLLKSNKNIDKEIFSIIKKKENKNKFSCKIYPIEEFTK